MPQIPFLIQFRQLAQTILQFLPSRHSFARGLLRPLRNVITRGLALLPTVADVQVRTMLGPYGLAIAALASASAVGFRQRSENSHLRYTRDFTQQLAPLRGGFNQLGHRASLFLRSSQRAMENRFLVITLQPT